MALQTDVGLGLDGRAALSTLGTPAAEPWFADPRAFTSHSGCWGSSPFERTSFGFRRRVLSASLAQCLAASLSTVSRTAAITEPSESLASLRSAPAEPSVVEPARLGQSDSSSSPLVSVAIELEAQPPPMHAGFSHLRWLPWQTTHTWAKVQGITLQAALRFQL